MQCTHCIGDPRVRPGKLSPTHAAGCIARQQVLTGLMIGVMFTSFCTAHMWIYCTLTDFQRQIGREGRAGLGEVFVSQAKIITTTRKEDTNY